MIDLPGKDIYKSTYLHLWLFLKVKIEQIEEKSLKNYFTIIFTEVDFPLSSALNK